jgi:hypothetical protein
VQTRIRVLVVLGVLATVLSAQGPTVAATKDDWEEINFVFDSAVLTDGHSSLLRLAELLNQNQDYTVTLIGHTDYLGSNQYNQKLGQARAETVRDYLVKNGARANQITIQSQGETQPKVPAQSEEARFMNRRVTMVVRDGQGRIVSAAGVGPAIRAIEQKRDDCCEEVLKRLKDQEAALGGLKNLEAENEKLRQDLEALRQSQQGIQRDIQGLPKPPERAELEKMMEATADRAIDKAKPNRFAILDLNIGPTLNDTIHPVIQPGTVVSSGGQLVFTPTPFQRPHTFGAGNLTATGKGRYFAPFGKTEMHALQAEGEYLYYRDRQEGQFDIGLVNRYKGFQLGLFSSLKHVNLTDLGGGTLGQAAVTADYVFSRGRVGMYGTKAYLNDRVVARTPIVGIGQRSGIINHNILLETYLHIADQIGAATQFGAWGDAYIDATAGAAFRQGGTNRFTGLFRLVQPFHPNFAFTIEADFNETMLGPNNTGRIVVGLRFGNWVRPKEFGSARHAVPAEVPRVKYEVLTRVVRVGNSVPVADAGPDQIGAAAGTITLDGSGSFDPEGDPLTYEWRQVSGPSVTVSNPNAANATFPAEAGHSYSFRLTVRDPEGAQDTDTVTVTTQAAAQVRIVRFAANPTSITAGQTTTLSWEVENAETVEITPALGQVNPRAGTATVSLNETTSYQLTARNRTSEVSETITVTVDRPQVAILNFQAAPAAISAGQSSSLIWQTQNAEEVTIDQSIGGVAQNGSTAVSPRQTTTYTITARNRFGEATATVTVQVSTSPPTIVSFAASPAQIGSGQSSTLRWEVQNADTVTIDQGIGTVPATGNRPVSPTATTTYTLTAKGPGGEVTATATVTVGAAVRITSYAANPANVAAGASSVLTWTTENATSAEIQGFGPVPPNGNFTVRPTVTTTYTLIARGPGGEASAQVTVTVGQGTGLTCSAGPNQTVTSATARLSATASDPNNRPLNFSWRSLDGNVFIANPTDASTVVNLPTSFGQYTFEVTVNGRCRSQVTVTYIDP